MHNQPNAVPMRDAIAMVNRCFRDLGPAVSPTICEDFGLEWEVEVDRGRATEGQLERLATALGHFIDACQRTGTRGIRLNSETMQLEVCDLLAATA